MSQRQRRFLFVNKNESSGSLSRSTSNERYDIFSHVQSKRWGKRSQQVCAEPWVSYVHKSCIDDVTIHPNQRGFDRDPGQALAIQHTDASLIQRLPLRHPTSNTADPFNAAAGGSDAHPALFGEMELITRMVFFTEAFAPAAVAERRPWIRHHGFTTSRLRQCVHDEALMYSTLAYAASFLRWNTGKVSDLKPPEYYIDKALRKTQARIITKTQPDDPWLLLSIYALAITALWNGIPELWIRYPSRVDLVDEDCLKACRTHLRALIKLVEHSGGWEYVDRYILESAILGDKYLAISSMIPPMMDLTWDPGPPRRNMLSDAVPRSEDLAQLGTNLSRHVQSAELCKITTDLVGYLRAAQAAWDIDFQDRDLENWLFLRLQAIQYRLLLLSNSNDTDDCIRMATLVFLLNAIEEQGARAGVTVLLPRFRRTLRHAMYRSTAFDDRLLFWCLCMGAMTAEPSVERAWFLDMTARQTETNSLPISADALAQELSQFLFIPSRQERSIEILVSNISKVQMEVLA